MTISSYPANEALCYLRVGSKVLLLTTNHVGNTLFCTPGIALLKKCLPHVQFDAVAMSARAAAALVDNPSIRKTYQLSWRWQIRRLAKAYDQIIGFHHELAHYYLAGIKIPHYIIGAPGVQQHRADEILDFVSQLLNYKITSQDRQYVLHYQPKQLVKIKKLLSSATAVQPIFVGIVLGCGRAAVHGWKFWYSNCSVIRPHTIITYRALSIAPAT